MTFGIKCTYGEFPDGLRCGDCSREIEWGERYSERFEGLMETALLPREAVAEVLLVCVPCAMAYNTGWCDGLRQFWNGAGLNIGRSNDGTA